MDALHNPFKQALKSGRLQIGLWHSLSSHLVGRNPRRLRIRLDPARHRARAERTADGARRASGDARRNGARRRPAGLERRGHHQAPARHRGAIAAHSLCARPRRRRGAPSCRPAIRPRASAASPGRRARRAMAGSRDTTQRPTPRSVCSCRSRPGAGLRTSKASQASRASTACSSARAIFRPALGYLGQPNHPEVVKIIDDMIGRIKAAGCAPGILTGDAELAQRYIERGCLFAAVGSDIGLLAKRRRSARREVQEPESGTVTCAPSSQKIGRGPNV